MLGMKSPVADLVARTAELPSHDGAEDEDEDDVDDDAPTRVAPPSMRSLALEKASVRPPQPVIEKVSVRPPPAIENVSIRPPAPAEKASVRPRRRRGLRPASAACMPSPRAGVACAPAWG